MNKNEIVRINQENPVYCSLVAETKEEKKALYNAINNVEDKVSNYINKKIKIANVHMESVQTEVKDDEGNFTGELRDATRIILITPENKGIICTSNGIARSLYGLFQIFGTPDEWEEPIECLVKQIETPKGRTFKLEIC